MRKRQFSRDLETESQVWVAEGLLSPDQRERIKALYPPAQDSSRWSQNLVAALAALLVGIGVIVLVSYNWEYFPKLVKLLIALLPLLASVGFLGYWGLKGSRVQLDVGVLLNGLSIFLALALVSQVYQLQGSTFLYIATCLVLWAPVVLLNRSLGGGLLFTLMAGAAYFFESWREPLSSWALLLFLVPVALGWFKTRFDGKPLKSLIWVGTLAFFLATVLSQISWMSQAPWIFHLTLAASLLSLLGQLLESRAAQEGDGNRPLTLLGQILTFQLLCLFSFTSFWENILPSSLLRLVEQWENVPVLWTVLAAITLLSVTGGSVYEMVKKRTWTPFSIFAGVFIPLLFLLLPMNAEDRGLWGALLASLLIVVQAVFWILDKEKRPFRVIGGALLVLAVVNLRFFDGDIPVLVKGTVFVLSGIAFWQLYLWKFKKELNKNKAADPPPGLDQGSHEGEK